MDLEREDLSCPNCGAPSIEGETPDGIRCWTCISCGPAVLDGAAAEWKAGTYLANSVQLFVDGNQIGALIGQDLVQGIAGFGISVPAALRDLADRLIENGIRIEVADPVNPLGGSGLPHSNG